MRGRYLLPRIVRETRSVMGKRMSQKQDGRFKMVKYILKKIGYMIVTLWVILTITFFLVSVIPGRSNAGGHQGASRGGCGELKGPVGTG